MIIQRGTNQNNAPCRCRAFACAAIKRDPFETSIGQQQKTLFGMGGALASPSTAYVYDWNMLPIGQALWLKELETYINFPPLQDPASYNLEQVMQQVRQMKTISRAGE